MSRGKRRARATSGATQDYVDTEIKKLRREMRDHVRAERRPPFSPTYGYRPSVVADGNVREPFPWVVRR